MTVRSVPGTYATIQAAFDGAANGDTILVSSTYAGSTSAHHGRLTTLSLDAPSTVTGLEISMDSFPGVTFTLTGGASVTVYASDGRDTLTGNAGNDTLYGRMGNDTLEGGGGADKLYGGYDDDILNGGDGDDVLDGGFGVNILNGGNGNDRFDDYYIGTTMNGGAGSDFFNLHGRDSIVFGDDGNDTFNDVGYATLSGGAGDDVFNLDGWRSKAGGAIDGGTGTDTIRTSNLSTYTFKNVEIWDNSGNFYGTAAQLSSFKTLTNSKAAADARFDIVVSDGSGILDLSTRVTGQHSVNVTWFQATGNCTIIGTRGADYLGGNIFDDRLEGGADNDTLFGEYGNDKLYGGRGSDTLNGGEGADTMDGGEGGDIYIADSSDILRDTGLTGTDRVISTSSNFVLANGTGIENIEARAGTSNDILVGDDKANRVTGNDGSNLLQGMGGDDRITGGEGSDTIDGGLGDDVLDGGAGIDTASYANAMAGVTARLGVSGAQNTGGAGTDTLIAVENLVGSAFGDTLVGNGQGNHLSGGKGDDLLIGGLGPDVLNGGAGADTFVFGARESTVAAFDTIVDFATGVDKMDLGIFAGVPPTSAYAETAVASDSLSALKSAAEAQMTGNVRAVFVAANTNGWLFWSTDANPATAAGAVMLAGAHSVVNFKVGDLY